MTARLTLICHGSTAAVRGARFPADEPLDDYGQRDAAALAGRLPSAERWLTGPERRTRQTAAALELEAAIEPGLRDCDYGSWNGRSIEDIYARQPEDMAAWLRDPAAMSHGGEALLHLLQRVADWLQSQQAYAQSTIAVTHAAVIRAAVVAAIGAPPQSFWRIDIAPLSITRLSGDGSRWNLVSSGSTTAD